LSNDLPDQFDTFAAAEFLVEATVELGEVARVQSHLVQDGGLHFTFWQPQRG